MNNIRRLFLVAAASAVAALAPSALAADPPTYVAFDAEGWRFATAIEAEGNILGFLSWVTDGTATGNNVTLLWHEHQPDGNFDSFAWHNNNLGEAALWLRAYSGDDSLFGDDLDVITAIELSDPLNAEAPYVFENGLFEDDPAQAIVSSTGLAPALLEVLTESGYATAPRLSSMAVTTELSIAGGGINPTPIVPNGCIAVYGSETGVLLNDLFRSAEALLSGDQPPVDNCSWPCKCTTTYGQWTSTLPGPWTSLPPTPISGGAHVCNWQRPATRPWSKSGKTYFFCLNCSASGTQHGCEHASDIGESGTACPATPPSGASFSFTPSCF